MLAAMLWSWCKVWKASSFWWVAPVAFFAAWMSCGKASNISTAFARMTNQVRPLSRASLRAGSRSANFAYESFPPTVILSNSDFAPASTALSHWFVCEQLTDPYFTSTAVCPSNPSDVSNIDCVKFILVPWVSSSMHTACHVSFKTKPIAVILSPRACDPDGDTPQPPRFFG